MEVRRITARKAYDDAAKRHDALMEAHIDHLTEIGKRNDEIRQRHDEAVEERETLQRGIDEATESKFQLAMQQYEEHVEWWEHHQAEKTRLGSLVKLIQPFKFKGMGEPFVRLGKPGEPPTKDEPEQLPPVPDPIFIRESAEPEFRHPEPEVYRVKKVEGDDYVEVDTLHGKTLASPGSYILTAKSTGEQHIVAEPDFKLHYEKVL